MRIDNRSAPSINDASVEAKGLSDSRSATRHVIVNDLMQRGYRYTLTEAPGANFATDFASSRLRVS